MRPVPLAAGACALALTVPLAALPAQAAGHEPTVVVDGLAGPLTLALGPGDSATYVTETFAGLLSKFDSTGAKSVLAAAPSPDHEVVGVSYANRATYHVLTDYTAGPPTTHVVRTARDGSQTIVSDDLWAHEIAENPDAATTYGLTGLDAECTAALEEAVAGNPGLPPFLPYQGIVESHGYQTDYADGTIYVADAAGNTIVAVDEATGDVSTVAVIPATAIEFPAGVAGQFGLPECIEGTPYVPEPVPTDVELAKDGMLYVSTLQGGAGEMFPLSKVYAVDPATGEATEVAGGMFGATGLAVATNGDIYVAEMFGGEVSAIRRGSDEATTLFTADSPGDVEARGANVFATTGIFGNGAIVRFEDPRD